MMAITIHGQTFTVKTEGELVLLLAALTTVAEFADRRSA